MVFISGRGVGMQPFILLQPGRQGGHYNADSTILASRDPVWHSSESYNMCDKNPMSTQVREVTHNLRGNSELSDQKSFRVELSSVSNK